MSDDGKLQPLPPLPTAYNAASVGKIVRDPGSQWSYVVSPMYTATQMIEYGRAVERAARAAECDAILRECVPGGDICDPQQIADAIRARAEEQR